MRGKKRETEGRRGRESVEDEELEIGDENLILS